MRNFFRLLILLPALSLGACNSEGEGSGPQPAAADLGVEYLLGFGETIQIGGLSLEFTTLAEESRCPINATCVWAGNARILVTATLNRVSSVLELNTTPSFGSVVNFEGFRIELVELHPLPTAPVTGPMPPPSNYVATIVVTRATP